MNLRNKRLCIILTSVTVLLLIPLTAMQFTAEVNWSIPDFVVAAALLLGTGILCEFTIRKISNTNYQIAICLLFLALLVLIWAELAVGIFGTPLSGQ